MGVVEQLHDGDLALHLAAHVGAAEQKLLGHDFHRYSFSALPVIGQLHLACTPITKRNG